MDANRSQKAESKGNGALRIFIRKSLIYALPVFIFLSSPANDIPRFPVPERIGADLPERIDNFPVTDRLQPAVDFWVDVFSKYGSNQVIIHDNRYLQVIYEVVNLDKEGFADEKAARRHIKERVKQYEKILGEINWTAPEEEDQEKKRILELFRPLQESPHYPKKDAETRIRVQTGQADSIRMGMAQSGKYLSAMKNIFAQYDLPPELAYLPIIESAYNPHAVSYAGAAGMWQIMPRTGTVYGLRVNPFMDERKDPLKATHAAARLLRDNYLDLKSWPLAITAYNHGLYGMKKAVGQTGSTSISDIIEKYQGPRFLFASRNFYPEFVAAVKVGVDSNRYFGEIETKAPLSLARIRMPDSVPLSVLEKYCGVSAADIRSLNPALIPSVFRKDGWIPKGYELNIPPEKAHDFLTGYGKIPKESRYAALPKSFRHRVRKGETLAGIAGRYGVSMASLKRTNSISRADLLRAGKWLKIPGKYAPLKTGGKKHRVESGQTLTMIARRYNTSVKAIAKVNSIENPARLRAGQLLRIPES